MSQETLTVGQLRAARAVLSMTLKELAELTSIGIATLKRYEAAEGIPPSRKGHLATLRQFYESRGIEFIGSAEDRPGIRIKGGIK